MTDERQLRAQTTAEASASLRAIKDDLDRGRLEIDRLPARLRAFADGVEEELSTPALANADEPGIGGAPLGR